MIIEFSRDDLTAARELMKVTWSSPPTEWSREQRAVYAFAVALAYRLREGSVYQIEVDSLMGWSNRAPWYAFGWVEEAIADRKVATT